MALGPPVTRPVRTGTVIGALLSAAALCAGVLVLAHVALQTYTGQFLDDVALAQARADRNAYLPAAVWRLAYLLPELVAGTAGVLALVWTVRTRRWLAAACALGMIAGANLTTQVLKHGVLSKADLGVHEVAHNSFPSGHTTATATLLLSVLLVVPPHARARAGRWGAVLAALTGIVTVVNGWHRPSDAAAGLLVAGAWGVLAVLALRFADAARARSAARAGADPSAWPSSRGGWHRPVARRENRRQRREREQSAYLPPAQDALPSDVPRGGGPRFPDAPRGNDPRFPDAPRENVPWGEPRPPGPGASGDPGAAASYPYARDGYGTGPAVRSPYGPAAAPHPWHGAGPYGAYPPQPDPYRPAPYGPGQPGQPYALTRPVTRPRVGTVITLLVLAGLAGAAALLWPTPTVAGTWAGRVTLVAGWLGIAAAAALSWCVVARWLRSRT